MPGPQRHLSSVAEDRKARLAQLKSLKRKQSAYDSESQPRPTDDNETGTSPRPTPTQDGPHADDQQQQQQVEDDEESSLAKRILSGRNYDADARGPRLGFDAPPQLNSQGPTLEEHAAEVESAVRAQQAADNAMDGENAGIDLHKLRPKKPNWDLKRELDTKLEPLNVKTHNAIARIVRERMAEEASKEQEQKGGGVDDGENMAVGLDGKDLVEGLKARVEEDAEEERREREELENMAGP